MASGWFGAAETGSMTFDIINRGPACQISGYPDVSFENASAIAVDHRDVHTSSMLFSEPRPLTVAIPRDGVATFGVSWSDNPVNDRPYNKACPETARVSWTPQPRCGETLWRNSYKFQTVRRRLVSDTYRIWYMAKEKWVKTS